MLAAGGAGGSTTFAALQKADDLWYKLRHARVRVHAMQRLSCNHNALPTYR